MKQNIQTIKGPNQIITDVDVVFVAMYNLLYEKVQTEPNKGIVVSKGNPNQRKVRWSDVLRMTHMLEDFFRFREEHIGCRTCRNCINWKSVSKASPHMGYCTRQDKQDMHMLHCCKSWSPSGGVSHE